MTAHRRRLDRLLLPEPDRRALAVWVASRLAIVLATTAGSALLAPGQAVAPFLHRWNRWDTSLLIEIARFGYRGDPAHPADHGLPAFFPGFPLLLRVGHALVADWTLAGLLISLVAGGVAAVALARLAELDGTPGDGTRAVAAWVLAPVAVFLFAAYTEGLFLALALPAWLLARQGRWKGALLCAAGAAFVRITGVFLDCALLVEFAMQARGGRVPWRKGPWLVVPFVPPLGYAAYQFHRTGSWLTWIHAQQAGWGRSLVWPWQSFATTWNAAFGVHNQFTDPFRGELVAAAVGVALTVWLLARRRWPEVVYVGGQVVALLTSSFYLSVPRAALLWWPLWILIARVGARRPYVFTAYAAVAGPLMIVLALVFTQGSWAG